MQVKSFNGRRVTGQLTFINTFWTNFSRVNTKNFGLSAYDPGICGYWAFQTNLDEDDLKLFMNDKQLKRFLHQMYDIYGVGPDENKESSGIRFKARTS